MKHRNYRYEVKFVINKKYAEILQKKLLTIMQIDPYGPNGYFIRSLYFDTPNSDAYYEKLDGVEYRKKYRIRIYGKNDCDIKLEKKLKHNNLTSKESILIDKKLCDNIIEGNFDVSLNKDNLLREFYIDMKTKLLRPSVIVDYERLALIYPISDIRITFDYNISSGRYNYNLFDYNFETIPVIDDNLMVLEVKFNEVLPESISTILSTVPICRQAFSKFAACRSIK